MNTFIKAGGIAALLHGAAYMAGMALFLSAVYPFLTSETAGYIAFVASHRAILHVGILTAYWVPAACLVVLVLAIYQLQKARTPALAQVATAFGLIWSALIIGSGNLMLYDFGVIADLYGKNSVQAGTVWLALQAVENGIVSGNEIVGSLWVLLVSLAALRTGMFTRLLNYFGIVASFAGLLTVIPAVVPAFFGLGMVVWSIWLGFEMLRSRPVINTGVSSTTETGLKATALS